MLFSFLVDTSCLHVFLEAAKSQVFPVKGTTTISHLMFHWRLAAKPQVYARRYSSVGFAESIGNSPESPAYFFLCDGDPL